RPRSENAHLSVSRPAPTRVRPGPVSAFVKSSDPLDSLGSGHSSTLGPGPLAQLAERRADNAEVDSSSLSRPTTLPSSKRPLFPPKVIAQPFHARYHSAMWITVPAGNRRGGRAWQ